MLPETPKYNAYCSASEDIRAVSPVNDVYHRRNSKQTTTTPAQATSKQNAHFYGVATEGELVSPVDEALRYLARAGYKGLTADDLARLSPRDQCFDDELVVMADVRAYFTIACKVWSIQ